MHTHPDRLLILGLAVYSCTTLISMATMSIGFGVLLGLTCLFLYFAENTQRTSLLLGTFPYLMKSSENQRFARVSIILALSCILSLVGALLYPVRYAGKGPELNFFTDCLKLWYFILPFFLAGIFSWLPSVRFPQIIKNWLYFAGLISIVGIIQFFSGWPRRQEIPEFWGHYHTTLFFGHHLSTASILIFSFFICLSLSMNSEFRTKMKMKSAFLGLITLLIGLTLFFTWSRTLWVALPIGGCVWIFRYFSMKKALITVGIMALMIAGLTQLPQIKYRIHTFIGTTDRFILWRANLGFFEQRPWTGVGWRKSQSLVSRYFEEIAPGNQEHFVGHAHNNLLEMLAGTGIIGTAAWLIWCFWIFRMSWKRSRKRDLNGEIAWGIFCAWIVFQINGLTQVNFWEGKVLHQIMWVTSFLLYFNFEELRRQPGVQNLNHIETEKRI